MTRPRDCARGGPKPPPWAAQPLPPPAQAGKQLPCEGRRILLSWQTDVVGRRLWWMLRRRQRPRDVPVRRPRFLSQGAGSGSRGCWRHGSQDVTFTTDTPCLPTPLRGRGSANSVFPRPLLLPHPTPRGPPDFQRAFVSPRPELRLGPCRLLAPIHTDTRAHAYRPPLGDFCWAPCRLLWEAPRASCFTGQSRLSYWPHDVPRLSTVFFMTLRGESASSL